MAFERIAENRIREAIRDGQLDQLPGRGRAIDLEDYFKLPEDLRLAYSILKNAGCVPAEVELLNDIASLERELANAPTAERRPPLERRLADARLRLTIALERARRA